MAALATGAPMLLMAASEGAGNAHGDGDITHRMTVLVMQLAIILIAAKIGGAIFKHLLRLPEVLGELTAGIVISPYALGPMLGGLFVTIPGSALPVTPELYGIATFASILLLYLAGLETDLPLFLRYSVVGSAVGIAGVIASFLLGDLAAVWWGVAEHFMDPSALFLGTISTATSVGITARILGEKRHLDTPEGVTILAGAVVDDVLGIIVLAVVLGISRVSSTGGEVAWGSVGLVAVKALGFWLVFTALGLLLAKQIGRVLKIFSSTETMAAVSLGLALLLAGISEKAGLALILGAYIMGLSLSRLDMAHALRHQLQPVYQTLISVFFCTMGMLVDIGAMAGMLWFSLFYTALAIGAKVIGCGLPPLFMGFNKLGAFRVGVGMLPRGEVALIVAGIGLASGFLPQEIFGVVIMMTLITTFVAPLIMVRIFHEQSGLRKEKGAGVSASEPTIEYQLPREEIAEFLLASLLNYFRKEGCYVFQVSPGESLHQVRSDDISISVNREGDRVTLTCREQDLTFARLMLLESLANLVSIFDELQEAHQNSDLRNGILGPAH